MIRKLIIMFRIAAALASYPLWSLAAAGLFRLAAVAGGWLATPRGALLVIGVGLAAGWDAVAEWHGGPS